MKGFKANTHRGTLTPTKTHIPIVPLPGTSIYKPSHWSLVSLNTNGLNFPIKIHRLREWKQKQDPSFCCISEIHLSNKDRYYLRVKDSK